MVNNLESPIDKQHGATQGNDSKLELSAGTTNSDANHPAEHKNRAKKSIKIAVDWVYLTAWPWIRNRIWRPIKRTCSSSTFWTALATVAIAVATCIYTYYARKQWQAMDSQLGEMKFARQQAIALQQAAVRISIPEFVLISPASQPALQIGLRNEGIAVATQVSFHGMFAWKAEPSHKTVGKATPVSIEIPAIPQGDKGARGYFITIPELTQEVLKLIRQSTKTRTIEFSGKLTYVNGFDQLISEDTCKDYFAREQSDVGFIDCDQYPAKVEWWANHEQEQKAKPN